MIHTETWQLADKYPKLQQQICQSVAFSHGFGSHQTELVVTEVVLVQKDKE